MKRDKLKAIVNGDKDGLDVWWGKIPYKEVTPSAYDGSTLNHLVFDNMEIPKQSPEQLFKTYKETGLWFAPSVIRPTTVFHLTIKPFTERIVIAQRQKIKPYKKNYATPKLTIQLQKDIASGSLIWSEKGYLTDLTGTVIPSNKNKAGEPRYWRVNGQDIYNGRIKDMARMNYIDKMHKYLEPWFTELSQVEETGLTLKVGFYIMREAKNLDNDNRGLWIKVIQDIMKKRILPEDCQEIICGNYHFTEYVQTEEEVRLEVELIKNYR